METGPAQHSDRSAVAPASESDLRDVPVFLCYRREDASLHARWLFRLLHEYQYDDSESRCRLQVYYDEAAPAVENWLDHHLPALEHASAILIIASPGIATDFTQGKKEDFVYKEIRWWLGNRKAAPIVIDPTKDRHLWLPRDISERWPNLNRILVKNSDLEAMPGSDDAALIRHRVVDSIKEIEHKTVREDRERLKKAVNRMRAGIAASVALLLAASVLAWTTSVQRDRARKAERQATIELSIANQTNAFITDLFEAADPDRTYGRDLSAGRLLENGAATINESSLDAPVKARLLRTIASAYVGLREYQLALPMLLDAEATTARYSASTRERFLLSLALGEVYLGFDGAYDDEAQKALEQAVALARILESPDAGTQLSWALRSLGDFYNWPEVGDLEQARQAYSEALAIDRGLASAADTARDLARLASNAYYRGDLDLSDALYDEAIAAIGPGQAPLLIAEIRHDRASSDYERGDLEGALHDYREAYALLMAIHGANSSEVAEAGNSLGRVLIELGRFNDAIEPLSTAVGIQESRFGNDYSGLVYTRANLGLAHMLSGRDEEAAGYFQKVIASCSRASTAADKPEPCPGDERKLLAQVLTHLAEIHMASGDFATANVLLEESFAEFRALDLTGDWRYTLWQSAKAEYFIRHCQFQEARRHLAPARENILLRWSDGGPFHTAFDRRLQMLEAAEARPNSCSTVPVA